LESINTPRSLLQSEHHNKKFIQIITVIIIIIIIIIIIHVWKLIYENCLKIY